MSKISHMDPAKTIISKVGGPMAVSRITGSHYTRVYRWMYPEGPRGGTGGVVPHSDALQLLEWAKENGVDLHPSHFMQAPSVSA